MKKGNKGFTLIELVVIIVCIGILAMIALPHFINISSQSAQSAEEDMVGQIRSAVQLVRAQNMVDNGNAGVYPSTLDGASVGQASTSNPFFTNILQDPYRGNDWTKNSSTEYVGPAGGTYDYNSSTGRFTKIN